MKHTENLTADRLLTRYLPQWEVIPSLARTKAVPAAFRPSSNEPAISICRIAMLVSGQLLDFEPIREHEPSRGGAIRSDNKKEKIIFFFCTFMVKCHEPVILHMQCRLWDGN